MKRSKLKWAGGLLLAGVLLAALLGGCGDTDGKSMAPVIAATEANAPDAEVRARTPYAGEFDVWADASTFGQVLTEGRAGAFAINPAVLSGGDGKGTAEMQEGGSAAITCTDDTLFLYCVSTQYADGTSEEMLYEASLADVQPGANISVWGSADENGWAADTVVLLELVMGE